MVAMRIRKKLKYTIARYVGGIISIALYWAAKIGMKSVTFDTNATESLYEKQFILAFWHGTMYLPLFHLKGRNYALIGGKQSRVIADIAANITRKWNYTVIRSSQQAPARHVLQEAKQLIHSGQSLLITPDGSSGPAHVMKPGAIMFAKATGVPLILAGVGCSKYRAMNTWDKFTLPKPFAKVKIIYSDPIYVKSSLTREEMKKTIKECQELLCELQRKAQASVESETS